MIIHSIRAKPTANGFPTPVALAVILVIAIAVTTVFLRERKIKLVSKKPQDN